jgi:superfamily II DNA or RNA helicase
MNNQTKGLLYEKYVRDFIIQNLNKNAYLWNECPENILIENSLIDSHNDMRLLRKDIKEGFLHCHKDIGIDIIQIEDNKCSMIQCKNGYTNGLCVNDIGGIMMRSNFLRNMNTYIYYTHCLSRNIRYTAKLSPFVVNIDCSINQDTLLEFPHDNKVYFVKLPYEDTNNKEIAKTEMIPYSYQTEAVVKFKEHFQLSNRGILSLPCGCGKTYTSYMISSDYNHIIILSPLREFASQNLNRFIEYGYDEKNTLLVDTDGNRDIDSIKAIIKNKNKLLISCTYNSMDLISECLDLFNDALFIVDEFHNLSKSNISDSDNHIFKLLMSEHKILFMSATPRIYDIEYDDQSFDMEWLFGDVVYQMTFTDAIANKYITDYRIWLPSIHENNEELENELSIYDVDNEIKNRCKFLYSCIANNGSRKCIVYCKDTEDMNAMMESMNILNEFYIMNIEINSISCKDNEIKRKHTLECFANNNDKIQLLFNIRILNECIDIPLCDSIYISYAPKNKITTIQRINRATRTDKNNSYKIANIYIWCDVYQEILETLSSIKEYDIMFKDKIKINAVDFYHSKNDKDVELLHNDKLLLSNYILDVKEFKLISWKEKLKMVEMYIKEKNKLPSTHDKNKDIKVLGIWISTQKWKYEKQEYIMKNILIRQYWEQFTSKYQHLFMSYNDKWHNMFDKIQKYIEENNKLPSSHDKNKDIKACGKWISTQKTYYDNKEKQLKDPLIRQQWKQFINRYEYLFMSNYDKWYDKLDKTCKYIQENNKLPSKDDQNEYIKSLGIWVSRQKQNYDNGENIMQDLRIKQKWEEFSSSYQNLFMSNYDKWHDTIYKIQIYIDNNNKLPSQYSKNKDIKTLGNWISTQKITYDNKEYIMTNPLIRQEWEQFTKKHQYLFKSNDDKWYDKLDKTCKYIQENNKLPSRNDESADTRSLSMWISRQKKIYNKKEEIMQSQLIRQKWEEFTTQHSKFFI